MEVIREDEPVDLSPDAVVAVGTFDGVHLGHQAVLTEVGRRAAEHGGPAVVVVREPAPEASRLTTMEHRLELIAAFAVDRAVLVAGAADRPPAVRGGTAVQVSPVTLPGRDEPISSAAIGAALARGDVELAAAMLGRPHEVGGVVEHGDERGRTLGFPTANLGFPDHLQLPADGVYGGWYEGNSGRVHLAAINLGRRPTFLADGVRLLEAYLLDFTGDLYGDHARVRFGARLRAELKFDSVDALVNQMHADVDAVRRLASATVARSDDAIEGGP